MQLKENQSIRKALAVASWTLLTQTSPPSQAAEFPWTADLSTLYYTEKDRVTVSESIAGFRREIGNEESIGLKVTFDAISGASANGAIFPKASTGTVQTITSPSGASRTLTTGGKPTINPLTPFNDTRIAAQFLFEKALGRMVKGRAEGGLGFENDYDSYGAGGTLFWDLNERRTTLTTGLSFNNDTVRPFGGTPIALNNLSDPTRLGKGEKRTIDLIVGTTQVLHRRTLAQINYTRGFTDGYLTDPYKIITVTDPAGEPVDYFFEKRPTTRNRNSLFWRTAHHLAEDVIHFAYRYAWDNWGIRSHTADLKYLWELGRGHSLQIHFRYYTQTGSDFYRYSLAEGLPLPGYVSADYRLGQLITETVGLKYTLPFGRKTGFSIRAEYIQQKDAEHRFPSLDVILVQATFSYSDLIDYALWSRPPP
ncbi:MAG: DUF3570 domain-containing protein [Candidatus Manganitrophaceae bacterium]